MQGRQEGKSTVSKRKGRIFFLSLLPIRLPYDRYTLHPTKWNYESSEASVQGDVWKS